MKKTITFCATLVLLTALISNVHGQVGSAPQQPAASNSAAPDQVARTQQAVAKIEKAIAILIPGGVKDGTPRKKQITAVVDSFVKGQARDAMQELEKMTAEDTTLPPAKLLMAGLTFSVGDNQAGLALLESSAINHPDYPGVYLSFAQLAINNNRITDASLHIDKTARLIDAGNMSPEWRNHFLKQYYEVATSVYLRRKKNQQANDTLEQLQALSPNLPFYFFSKAELAFRDGKNDVALQFLKQHGTVVESKRLPELTLVDWLKTTGKEEEGKALLLQTRQQNPKDSLAQMMTAQMYMAGEDFPNALTALGSFEDANGGETKQSLDMKGRIAFAGLSYDAAAEHFKKVASNDASSANILALCLVESNDPEKRKQAIQISQQVASRMSGNVLALGSLAYIYLKNGEKEKSDQLMQRVVLSRQATPEISYFLANSLIENGQPEQAAKILEKVVDSKGLFLYRSASRKLLASLEAKK